MLYYILDPKVSQTFVRHALGFFYGRVAKMRFWLTLPNPAVALAKADYGKKIFILSFLILFLGLTLLHPDVEASSRIYWGAWAGGAQYGKSDAPFDMTTLDTFENHAGKKVSIVRWGQPWKYAGSWMAFPVNEMNKVRSHGSISLLDWGSWSLGLGESRTSQPDFQNADVASGVYDSYIRNWADAAKNWGYPFFLRFNFELNGWWYSFQEGRLQDGSIVNGNRSGDYIRAWKHVWNVFNCVNDGIFIPQVNCKKVTNATWTWTVNIISTELASNGLPRYPDLSQVYPGDTYVDWIGLSLYNKNSTSYSFNSLFTGAGTNWLKNTYQLLSNIAPSKPMIIAELGAYEYNNDPLLKAHWLTDTIGYQIPVNFPKLKAIVYYNSTDESGNSGAIIETSPEAQLAFKNAIALVDYSINSFANLPMGTKIQPLGASLISPTSVLKPGDANSDGYVDGRDYVIWVNNYGRSLRGASYGDFNNNGFVDGQDYVIWLNNYGT